MSTIMIVGLVARVLGFLFLVLVVAGLWSRRHRFARFSGVRQALRRAGQRFARGEIDEETFRRLRDDLGSEFRR